MMSSTALLPAFLVSAFFFDVWEIPLSDPSAPVFLAHADADKTTAVFVLNGSNLTAYSTRSKRPPTMAVLADGTSGFDVADIDEDGVSEIIAVCGDNIMSYKLVPAGSAPVAKTLFVQHNQLSAPAVQPFPYVMVVRHDDLNTGTETAALALPCENTFELRRFDGTLIASYPIGSETSHRISYGSPFSAAWIDPPQSGPPGSIEAEVNRVIAFEPELPPDLLPIAAQPPGYRRGTLRQARDAAGAGPNSWPWFPLKTDGSTAQRALYALAGPDYRDSVVCVRDAKSEAIDLSGKNVVVGPQRRYPGVLCVLPEDLPDFNGDGYVDLLLWQAPEPGVSVDSLTRVVLGQKWTVTLTAHLFSPEKNRFEPRPAAHVAIPIPVDWFMSMTASGPLRHMVLRDFDGDGRTDLGCAVGQNEWAAWLFGEAGLPAQPDFLKQFDEPIERVEFRASLDGGAATALGLRTRTWLHMLYPPREQ
ncbi:MAG TPA: hypothetical protein VMZ06_02300 [Candidatus Bathyarchaeia archaeon]|nr:hypothetical protein [Candidatus Bathyarchaeia archaeon]